MYSDLLQQDRLHNAVRLFIKPDSVGDLSAFDESPFSRITASVVLQLQPMFKLKVIEFFLVSLSKVLHPTKPIQDRFALYFGGF